MDTSPALVTISFRKPGTQPPVFLAGSFSDPAWQLRPMQCTRDDSGENHFTAQASVQPGLEYRYKFKLGDDGGWVLDQHSSVATDKDGNATNTLKVPVTSGETSQLQTPLEATERQGESRSPQPGLRGTVTTPSAPGKSLLNRTLFVDSTVQRGASRTPVEVTAQTAAEVADTAAKLDDPERRYAGDGDRGQGQGGDDDDDDLKTPLFAHESFGAYISVDDGLDRHGTLPGQPKSPDSRPSLSDCGPEDIDAADPTLERFPSDKTAVMDALRKLQSCTDDSRPYIEDAGAASPRASPRASVDSSDGGSSALSQSPASVRRRENRSSLSSFGHTRSAVSLGSIAEEPKAGDADDAGAAAESGAKQRGRARWAEATTPPTDEEPLMMKL